MKDREDRERNITTLLLVKSCGVNSDETVQNATHTPLLHSCTLQLIVKGTTMC